MTLKQKLAEKERLAAENVRSVFVLADRQKGKEGYDDLIDGRTEQDRRREARERELEADLAVASDLMGDLEVSTGEWAVRANLQHPNMSTDSRRRTQGRSLRQADHQGRL